MDVSLEEYFKSTFEDKLLVKMPEREDDHLTSATRLLEKKREMAEVETALGAQKEEFQMKMESLQQRREELEKKEHQLKESLLKFDRFLKETDAKRVRALRKASDERAYRREKEQEILKIQEDMKVFSKLRERLCSLDQRYKKFQKYLERVIEASEDFAEVREVMDRFETLSSTFKDLKSREARNQDNIEAIRTEQSKSKEEKVNEVLAQNNKLSGLRQKFDGASDRALQRDAEWSLLKSNVADRTLQIGLVRVSTYNLFRIVSKFRGLEDDVDVDGDVEAVTGEHLSLVKQFIIDNTEITEAVVNKADGSESSF